MKKAFTLFLIILCSFSVFGKDLQNMFKQGNDTYAKGSYADALNHYREIEKMGLRSPELYFNMGNAYFKLDSLASAILYYERARLLAPSDEDILFNLDAANQKTIDRIDRMPVLFIKDWWQRLGSALSLDGWSFLSVTGIWISLAALAIYIVSRKRSSRIAFFSIFGFLLIGSIFTFIIATSQNTRLNKEKEGIIFSPTITIKSAPASGKELFVLHEGTKVRILDRTEGWVKIKLGNGNVGWLPETGIQGI